MLKGSIIINKPLDVVWKSIEKQFAKSFKTSPSKLPDAKMELKQKVNNREIIIEQSVLRYEPNTLISFQSLSKDVQSITTYSLNPADEFTRVTLTDETSGQGGVIRRGLFFILTLPPFNQSAKSRLKTRLKGLKLFIESE